MDLQEFIEGLIVAIDLPDLEQIDPDVAFTEIKDFDSLATLGVMTFVEIDFDKSISGEWLWDEKVTPGQLYSHVTQ